MEFLLDAREGVEEELADVGENGGVAGWNAILGDGGEELAEDEVDVGGGEEVAADGGGDFRTKLMRLEELLLGAGVEGTKGEVIAAKHAATAAVGKGELTEPGFDLGREGVRGIADTTFSGHKGLEVRK